MLIPTSGSLEVGSVVQPFVSCWKSKHRVSRAQHRSVRTILTPEAVTRRRDQRAVADRH